MKNLKKKDHRFIVLSGICGRGNETIGPKLEQFAKDNNLHISECFKSAIDKYDETGILWEDFTEEMEEE